MEPEFESEASVKKSQSPEVLALIPDGIEKFIPRCIVCTNLVPSKRRTSRSKSTCSPACLTVLQMFRRHVLTSAKCIACYHPSTPEERIEFKAWRRARGELREKPGRPKPAPKSPTPETENPVDVTADVSVACDVLARS